MNCYLRAIYEQKYLEHLAVFNGNASCGLNTNTDELKMAEKIVNSPNWNLTCIALQTLLPELMIG